MALFGDKGLKEENEKLKRQLDILSRKVKRFEQNVRTGIFSVGLDADLEQTAQRLEIQGQDLQAFLAVCKGVISSKNPATFTFHDKETRRFDCEIKPEADRLNVIRRDTSMLEATLGRVLTDKVVAGGRSMEEVYRTLEPVQTRITVLFVDLRNFTPYAEGKTPAEVAFLLAGFFKQVHPVIYESGGLVNKTLGDGVMALFGAPYEIEDQEKIAVKAGLEILKGWAAYSSGKNTPGAGVGVATGDCIVGNFGLKGQIDYTALGDTVNTASRLGSAPSGRLWASGTTVEACKLDFSWKKLEPMSLKGKSKPLDVYELTA